MDTQTEKLELIRLLLDTNDQEILKQIAQLLKHQNETETEYLLGEDANKKHLETGMEQAKQKKYKAVDPNDLWK
ncbi:MAG: hypothetical protein ACLFUB_15865 [Cyclobacteriaceae bacterium]